MRGGAQESVISLSEATSSPSLLSPMRGSARESVVSVPGSAASLSLLSPQAEGGNGREGLVVAGVGSALSPTPLLSPEAILSAGESVVTGFTPLAPRAFSRAVSLPLGGDLGLVDTRGNANSGIGILLPPCPLSRALSTQPISSLLQDWGGSQYTDGVSPRAAEAAFLSLDIAPCLTPRYLGESAAGIPTPLRAHIVRESGSLLTPRSVEEGTAGIPTPLRATVGESSEGAGASFSLLGASNSSPSSLLAGASLDALLSLTPATLAGVCVGQMRHLYPLSAPFIQYISISENSLFQARII